MPRGIYDRAAAKARREQAAPAAAAGAQAAPAAAAKKLKPGPKPGTKYKKRATWAKKTAAPKVINPAFVKSAEAPPRGAGYVADLYDHLDKMRALRVGLTGIGNAHGETPEVYQAIDGEIVQSLGSLRVWREMRFPTSHPAPQEEPEEPAEEPEVAPAEQPAQAAPTLPPPAPVPQPTARTFTPPPPPSAVGGPPLAFTPEAVHDVMKSQSP